MDRLAAKQSLEQVFDIEFDPHRRGKSCLKLIEHIKNNKIFSKKEALGFKIVPEKNKSLNGQNQAKLLEYMDHLVKQINREEINHYTFYKNLSIAWRFCQFVEKPVNELTKEDCEKWFEFELERFESKKASYETLKKNFLNAHKFLKWCVGLKKNQPLELFSNIELPKRKRNGFPDPSEIPNQQDIKKLVECLYVEGKRFSLRNQAIVFIANATGARISEILSMQNKDVVAEQNYVRIYLRESKTLPRTVIAHKSDYLDRWGKASPNKDKDGEAFFFCQANGEPCKYAIIRKQFNSALRKSGIPWPKRKGIHFLRSLFSSRAKDWGYNIKKYWMGWSQNGDIEGHYTMVSYKDCVEAYFKMLEKEQNPFFTGETPFWENNLEAKLVQKLMKKEEFRKMLGQLARELSA